VSVRCVSAVVSVRCVSAVSPGPAGAACEGAGPGRAQGHPWPRSVPTQPGRHRAHHPHAQAGGW